MILQTVYDAAAPGDVINVPAGNYAGITAQAKGQPGKPITFNFSPGVVINAFSAKDLNHYAALNFEQGTGYVILNGPVKVQASGTQKAGIRMANTGHMSGCEVRGAIVSGAFTGIFFGGIDNGVISGCTCSGATDQHGVYISGCRTTTVEKNTCHDNPWNGIHTNVRDGTDTINTGNIIRWNHTYGNGQAGIDHTGAQNFQFYGNHSHDNGSHGVVWQNSNQNVTPTCSGNAIYNNTMLAPSGHLGIAFGGKDNAANSANTTIFNNIAIGGIGLSAVSGNLDPSCKLDHNILSSTNLFVSSTDHHLAVGSQAIDSGDATFNGISAATIDIDGLGYGTPDVGCYAAGSAPPPPTSITLTDAIARKYGDCNMDGVVNIQDHSITANNFGKRYDYTTGTYK